MEEMDDDHMKTISRMHHINDVRKHCGPCGETRQGTKLKGKKMHCLNGENGEIGQTCAHVLHSHNLPGDCS